MARGLLWQPRVLWFIAILAAQTPDALDLFDRLDLLPLSDVAEVEALLQTQAPTSPQLQLDLQDLPVIPSRRRAVSVAVRYFEAWSHALDHARRDRSLEVLVAVDLAAWWLPSPDSGAPPLAERERRDRCAGLPNFSPTPLLAAYYRASWRALACGEVAP